MADARRALRYAERADARRAWGLLITLRDEEGGRGREWDAERARTPGEQEDAGERKDAGEHRTVGSERSQKEEVGRELGARG